MAGEELKRALQREGEAAARSAWHEAEQKVAARRLALDKQEADLRAATKRRAAADIALLRDAQLHTAHTRARALRLQAEVALGERLSKLAVPLLAGIADEDRATLWQGLLAEIPEASWVSARVHPADLERAQRDLPQAEVETEESLGGGMIVATAGGRVQVDNSLRHRLQRVWPELLPKLLAELSISEDKS